MFKFETSDQKEVRRLRTAQFNGRTATVHAADSTVTGYVRAIVEKKSSMPTAWVITIIPEEPRISTIGLRPASHTRAFAEDFL